MVFLLGKSVFPFLSFSFHIDSISFSFIFIISLIALFCSLYGLGYIEHFYKKYSIGVLGFFYNLFLISMFLVVSVSNGLFFLIVWEIMSTASYFLVVYDRNNESNIKAGVLYFIMTHIGTVFIILSFLFLFQFTHSFDFEIVKSSVVFIPSLVKDIIFVFALIGFGTKAGIIPFHIWLPNAHPAAPSHVSALMSGVMIKTGIFMMIRLFFDILQPVPVWWGLVMLIVGALSSLIGVLYALTEHDIKRLLAYHSIENIGIILLGLGSALTFLSLGMPSLASLGFIAGLFHTLNHAIFKSLLFLISGAVINQTHTRNMEEYGGLIKQMPQTAFFFLVGSMAISALPPFNGFFSEWMTFQALFQGIASLDFFAKWIFILAAGALAFTGGLALSCFVKAFGITFLARPRSLGAAEAKESSFSLRASMGALAVFSLLFGIFSDRVNFFLEKIVQGFGVFHKSAFSSVSFSVADFDRGKNFFSVSGFGFFFIFIGVFFLTMFFVRFLIHKNQKIKIGATWDCGVDLTPRMEITATGFARSIILIFRGVLRPSIQQKIEYSDSEMRYLPKSRAVILGIHDLCQLYFYRPLQRILKVLSCYTKKIQSGNINVYISYIFIALIVAIISIF